MPVEKAAVGEAFERLTGFLSDGSATVSGDDIAKLCDAIKVVEDWSKGLKRCLDGARCPATITMVESPSGFMVDADTPGPTFCEFKAESQAP